MFALIDNELLIALCILFAAVASVGVAIAFRAIKQDPDL